MRFLKLKLAAFLSFKDVTEIDFAQFGNKLTLLFGGSGVGKTAIFDGITFALFGRGSGKDRCAGKVEDYHSDFAKEQDQQGNVVYRAPMQVELEFEHDGKLYNVAREIKWGENGKNKGFTYEMELQCEGESIVRDTKRASNGTFTGNFADKVSTQVMEMLGLSAEQFSQVVILAQGEFAKFLNANAQDREAILTKLVDNEAYVDFQLRLKELKNYLKRTIETIDTEIEQHLNILKGRPTISEEEKSQYQVVDEELLVALRTNLESKVEQIGALQRTINEQEAEVNRLNAQKGAADEQNKLFDAQQRQLADAQAGLAALQKSFDIEHWEKILTYLVKLQEILPQFEAFQTATQELKRNEAAISGFEQDIAHNSLQEAKLAQAKVAVEQENTPQISVLEGTCQRLEKALALYDGLKTATERLDELAQAFTNAEGKVKTNQTAYEKAVAMKEACEQQLEALGNATARRVELEGQLKDAKQQVADLKRLQEDLQNAHSKQRAYVHNKQTEQQAEQEKDACLKAYDLAQQEYYVAEQKFQSGSIASKVREQVQAKQLTEVECPVCHTMHKVEALAQWESCAELPEKSALAEAKAKYEGSAQKLVKAQNESSTSKVAYEIAQQNVLQRAELLLEGAVSWEELQNFTQPSDPVAVALAQKQEHRDALERAFASARAKAEQQDRLQDEMEKVKASLSSLKKAWDGSILARDKAKQAMDEQKNEVAKVQGMLVGCPATQEQAFAELADAKKAKAALQQAVHEATEALHNCTQAIANATGKLEQAQQNQQALVNKVAGCKVNYEAALAGCGASEDDFFSMHEECRNRDGKKLTSNNVAEATHKTRAKVEEFRTTESRYLHTIASVTEWLKGKQRIETTAFVNALKDIGTKLNEDKKAKEALQTDKEFTEQTLTKVTACFSNRVKKQRVHQVIEPLADAANTGITFNRYVLEDLFCAMLDKANDRLSVLCSGQYELRPIEEGQAKRNQGLGFTVYDCINQSHRESGANSGGEKFEISLSLALGLSDIVQSCSKKASRIESLFIDEGFGTLGKEELEKTKRLLLELSGGSRQIGIISHNPVLEEAIKNQIIVERDKHTREGTKVSFTVDC
ncbi:MAG: AAA family ATPase [Phascolarctobacterium sp.]